MTPDRGGRGRPVQDRPLWPVGHHHVSGMPHRSSLCSPLVLRGPVKREQIIKFVQAFRDSATISLIACMNGLMPRRLSCGLESPKTSAVFHEYCRLLSTTIQVVFRLRGSVCPRKPCPRSSVLQLCVRKSSCKRGRNPSSRFLLMRACTCRICDMHALYAYLFEDVGLERGTTQAACRRSVSRFPKQLSPLPPTVSFGLYHVLGRE